MKKKFMIGFYGLAAFSLAMSAHPSAAQDRQVVISASGGSYEKTMRQYWLDPLRKLQASRS
ncbi:hypothetical protein EN751_29895 [Mesorhizobium sp. M4A.F.Ca.ET.029.04.2.1]|nr:hypothetical protein EN751_29895 [Mesorhizobium sp. M4A.F.Ca.ET.029.04.2.1]